jgi:hypothetical protein
VLSLRWCGKKVEELVEQENLNASIVPLAWYKNIFFVFILGAACALSSARQPQDRNLGIAEGRQNGLGCHEQKTEGKAKTQEEKKT